MSTITIEQEYVPRDDYYRPKGHCKCGGFVSIGSKQTGDTRTCRCKCIECGEKATIEIKLGEKWEFEEIE